MSSWSLGPFKPLGKLAFAILARFQELGSKDDLDEAITYFGEAIKLCPSDHTDRRKLLNDVELALSKEKLGRTEDLVQHHDELDEDSPVIEQPIDSTQASQTLDLQ